jgi:hypothetical protein
LFGGAALYIGTGDEDSSQPLDIERIGKASIKHLTVLTRRQLKAGTLDRDPESEWFNRPENYYLTGLNGKQITIHPSRLRTPSRVSTPTLLLDAEEEYESKSAQLSGLNDILMAFMQIVSGAADIPDTRLLGQSPAGMNATGTSEMKNYHDRIQSIQELELTPAMSHLDECLIRSATGSRDEAIYYDWAPLEQMSEKERADIFKTKSDAARALIGSTAGQEIITREALSDALVNTFTEDGSPPGLGGFVDEYGKLSEQEPSEAEIIAAATPTKNN